ncbi:prepilin peptidase [Aliidiomarina haloalkalitolerans]|uniref:Prepilin leader peptidase/N-methyltransferase n=1 Tax=Aliidiomarina haloalkalitolerans TaxID=859059 RepID=A0A432VSY3_9GAMM|nr:A24 family peptidase [Aliidiomarina haloalkalitolerans]RUO19497.1 prepilin peptidase [Aliidiomarina haloalkalitolerans]
MTEILQVWPWFGWVFALLIGLCFGSFANVVIARLPVMMQAQWRRDCAELTGAELTGAELAGSESTGAETKSAKANKDASAKSEPQTFNLAQPASQCPTCQTPIRWYDNVPLLSYALLRGRCRSCNTSISIRYPLVELFTAALTAVTIYTFGFNALGWSYALFIYVLLILTLIDRDHMLLPDQLTLPLLWFGLIGSIFWLPVSPQDAIIGATAGYLFLWSVFWLFKIFTGKEGMGYGDFKLLAALGAWLGWQHLPLIILLSSVVGAVYGIGQILQRNSSSSQPMPFGPFLAIAGGISLYFSEPIYRWYWSIALG